MEGLGTHGAIIHAVGISRQLRACGLTTVVSDAERLSAAEGSIVLRHADKTCLLTARDFSMGSFLSLVSTILLGADFDGAALVAPPF